VLAVVCSLFLSAIMPTGVGYMAALFYGQIYGTKVKLRLQTGLTDRIVDLLVMPDDQFRNIDHNEIRSAFRIV
jgi:hypothetical protein